MSRDHRGRGGGRRRERAPGPIWTRPEPARRRPRYTREEIAAAALAIADADGFEAVSMRRVATELRAGTMTLYHYIRDKDELVALMDDAVMAELLVPDEELPTDWREAVAAVARRTRAAHRRHPWAWDSLRNVQIGPNGVKHAEQSLAAIAGLGLDPQLELEIVAQIDDYVFGFNVRSQELEGGHVALDDLQYMGDQLGTGRFPQLERLAGERGLRGIWDRFMVVLSDEDRFERGLTRLLDGIELDLRRRVGDR